MGNMQRTEMGLKEYEKTTTQLFSNINTSDTYTMCLWGISQVADLLTWNINLGYRVSLAKFFEESPIHVAMYEIDKDRSNKRHLESQKKYYLDFMFWSNSVSCPTLPSRYTFRDAPEE